MRRERGRKSGSFRLTIMENCTDAMMVRAAAILWFISMSIRLLVCIVGWGDASCFCGFFISIFEFS